MGSFKNIYGPEGLKVADLIKNGNDDKLLIKNNDEKTYNLLKKIVNEYYNNSKINPFEEYQKEHGYIKKYSKKGNGPIIRDLRYIYEKLGNHVDITSKYIKDTNETKVVLLKVSPYRTDFYINKEGKYKILTVRYCDIITKGDNHIINNEIYLHHKKIKNITDEYKFLFSCHRNEYITIQENDGEFNGTKMFRFLGTADDSTNRIELKSIDIPKDNSRLIKTIGNKTRNICKYHVDVLGKIYKVSKEVLHFEI